MKNHEILEAYIKQEHGISVRSFSSLYPLDENWKKSETAARMLCIAFSWSKTSQGDTFWRQIYEGLQEKTWGGLYTAFTGDHKILWLGGRKPTQQEVEAIGCEWYKDYSTIPHSYYIRQHKGRLSWWDAASDRGTKARMEFNRVIANLGYTEVKGDTMWYEGKTTNNEGKTMNIKQHAANLRQSIKPYEKYIIAVAAIVAIDYLFFGGKGSDKLRSIAKRASDKLLELVDTGINKLLGGSDEG